jgi:hypothetical protein
MFCSFIRVLKSTSYITAPFWMKTEQSAEALKASERLKIATDTSQNTTAFGGF